MAVQINLARVRLSTQDLEVFVRPFSLDDRMPVIRRSLGPDWDAYRAGDKVYAWRLADGHGELTQPFEKKSVTVAQETAFFGHMLVAGVTRHLQGKGFEITWGVVPSLVDRSTNLLDGQLSTPCDRRVAIHPEYQLDSFYQMNGQGEIELMLLIGAKTEWRLSIPVAELVQSGVSCAGFGASLFLSSVPRELEHLAGRFVGVISRVAEGHVELADPRDPGIPRIPAHLVWPEGSRPSFRRYFQDRHPAVVNRVWQEVLSTNDEISKPLARFQRVRELVRAVEQEMIPLARGLTAQLDGLIPSYAGPPMATVPASNFVFDYASKTKDSLAVRGLKNHGPYDKGNPPLKNPKILVLCPKLHSGLASTFFKAFEQGCTYPNRSKRWHDFPGFAKMFPLGTPKLVFDAFVPAVGEPIASSYHRATMQRLSQDRDAQFCFVVTEDAHKELAASEDPYCVVKSLLLAHGIPVSEVTAEDMRVGPWQLPFILVNMALQAYAKIGGVPFVLEAEPSDKLELILGVGRADIGASRFGRKRVVGFATVFKNNGDYLIGAVRPLQDPENYATELSQVIEEGLREAIEREGVASGTPIRLIFHIYKRPGKSKEIAALEAVLQRFSGYPVEYAFLHVSDTHPWLVVDDSDEQGIAPRGLVIKLTPNTRLVNLIGSRQYLGKGSPAPLKVSLDRRSTYRDIDRLTAQVYDFANVSWRGFNPCLRPVTIRYAQLAADLAGKLEQTADWNPAMLTTFLKDKKWFL